MSSDIVPSLKGAAIVKSSDLQGYDGLDVGDMNVRPPSIRIVQAMRPDAIRGRRDLAEGDLYDTLSYEQLANPISVIPFAVWNDYTCWKKGPDGRSITGADAEVLWQTTNSTDPRVIGKTRGHKMENGKWMPAEVVKTLRMLAIRPGISVPVQIAFAKTSLTCGEQIVMAAMSKGKNLFDQAILLGTKGVPSPEGGMYYVFTARPHPDTVEDEFKAIAKEWTERYRSLRQEVQAEHD